MANICVFLGASDSQESSFKDYVTELGKEIARNNHQLIYGGSSLGLMGCLAGAVLDQGGKAIGITTTHLQNKEIKHSALTELHIVETMQERKQQLADKADCFIVLPGGLGTLEEFFEVWNAVKIGEYEKPIKLLNINGFYTHLFAFLDNVTQYGFITAENMKHIEVYDDVSGLMNSIANRS